MSFKAGFNFLHVSCLPRNFGWGCNRFLPACPVSTQLWPQSCVWGWGTGGIQRRTGKWGGSVSSQYQLFWPTGISIPHFLTPWCSVLQSPQPEPGEAICQHSCTAQRSPNELWRSMGCWPLLGEVTYIILKHRFEKVVSEQQSRITCQGWKVSLSQVNTLTLTVLQLWDSCVAWGASHGSGSRQVCLV